MRCWIHSLQWVKGRYGPALRCTVTVGVPTDTPEKFLGVSIEGGMFAKDRAGEIGYVTPSVVKRLGPSFISLRPAVPSSSLCDRLVEIIKNTPYGELIGDRSRAVELVGTKPDDAGWEQDL